MKQTQKPHTIAETEEQIAREFIRERNIIISKFPLPFALLGAFGLVATFYGFEHLIDSVPFLVENPLLLLALGILSLAITGKFYKKLD